MSFITTKDASCTSLLGGGGGGVDSAVTPGSEEQIEEADEGAGYSQLLTRVLYGEDGAHK